MFSMLRSTFQLVPGLGPMRERRLWSAGVAAWSDFMAARLPSDRAGPIRACGSGVSDAMEALDRGDVARLANALPRSEHWRLFESFGADAAYLDIETGDDVWGRESISAIGFSTVRPAILVGRARSAPVSRAGHRWKVLVTFNGLSFDVPILRRAFPDWAPPACHIDLRHLLTRLGHRGGLKRIEDEIETLNLSRPWHLRRIDGWDACNLFRRGRDGDRGHCACSRNTTFTTSSTYAP